MKIAVLDFLKKEHPKKVDRFNEAMQLLTQTVNAPTIMQRNYNVRGYTPQALDSLEYDLKKLHDISDLDIRRHIVTIAEPAVTIDAPAPLDKNLFFAANKDLFSNILKDMNDEEKSGFKMRERYPFLRSKECPTEFLTLVGQAITAFDSFKEAHTQLFNDVVKPTEPQLTNEEIYAIAVQLLEDFEINREIYDELEYYLENKEILANHEIFAELKKNREIDALSDLDLKQRINNISSNISKKKTAIEKSKDKARTESLELDKLSLENEKKFLSDKLKARQENTGNSNTEEDEK